jgi:Tfp pilus assembly protein PilN
MDANQCQNEAPQDDEIMQLRREIAAYDATMDNQAARIKRLEQTLSELLASLDVCSLVAKNGREALREP